MGEREVHAVQTWEGESSPDSWLQPLLWALKTDRSRGVSVIRAMASGAGVLRLETWQNSLAHLLTHDCCPFNPNPQLVGSEQD